VLAGDLRYRGTRVFRAPEASGNAAVDLAALDVFAFGKTLKCLAAGDPRGREETVRGLTLHVAAVPSLLCGCRAAQLLLTSSVSRIPLHHASRLSTHLEG
jgi:hypothetical protein